MGQTPNEIRREIDHTRDEMTETARALGYKADVPSRARHTYEEKKQEWFGGDPTGEAKQQAGRVKRMAEDNPFGLIIGGFALGFLGGALLPATRFESSTMRPVIDEVEDRAVAVGEEAIDRGRDVAMEAARAGAQAAANAGSQAAGERGLAAGAKEAAQAGAEAAQKTATERGSQEARELAHSQQQKGNIPGGGSGGSGGSSGSGGSRSGASSSGPRTHEERSREASRHSDTYDGPEIEGPADRT